MFYNRIRRYRTGSSLAPILSCLHGGARLPTATQIRVCQIGACSQPVPSNLVMEGVCLGHYLDSAFTRLSAVLELCRSGRSLDAGTSQWLAAQGDFAVKLLSDKHAVDSQQRPRLLELLLCLANVQELLRRNSVSKA